MSKHWKKFSEEIIHQNPWWQCKHVCFEKPKGGIGDYYYGETGGSVIVVPVLSDGRIVLIWRHRCLDEKQSVEFPCGRVKAGQTVPDAARAELSEETGCAAGEYVKVGEFEPLNGLFKDRTNVFLAYVEGQKDTKPDDTEEIEVLYRRPDEIDEMVRKNEIWDGKTLAAWALVHFEFLHKSQLV
ncbi:MAG: NUDIX hydrolase [Candidatus Magasanikbacteria bacterium]|nr:NUDIX hydrolase [Candidatus Magasanikbacteria bacterium]